MAQTAVQPQSAQAGTAAPAVANTPSQNAAAEVRAARRARYNPSAYSDYSVGGDDSFYEKWIKGRLSLGLTYSIFSLSEGNRPANREQDFLGNVNELTEYHPMRFAPVLEYKVCDYLSLSATFMHISICTMNFNNHLGDGVGTLEGPALGVDLTYPLFDGKVYPHAGIGVAFLAGDFEEDTWWHLGYSNPESRAASRHPNKRHGKYYRYIDVDDAVEPYYTFGVSYLPHPHVKLDVSYRRICVDPDCEFGYDYTPTGGVKDKHSDGDFDMSGGFWLFSVSYVF